MRVRTLVTGATAAGSYEAVWDGRNEDGRLLGSGVYVYRLEGTGWTRANRVTLIR